MGAGPRQGLAISCTNKGGTMMRYFYIGVIVVFTTLVLVFKFQNLESATIPLFSASITLPMSVLVSLKTSIRGARRLA